MNTVITVSNIVTTHEIKQWKIGDIITITAGTGVGKSYFIKNILYAYAKENHQKILMLIHRTNCVEQFQREIERDKKTDVIDIETYQKLEYKNLNGYKNYLNTYKYIVCDEFHYFMSDALFNKTTDVSLNCILNSIGTIRIFMSATGHYMKNYINNIKHMETINYEIPASYNFIQTLRFFNKDETIEKYIKECIETKSKAIFFIQSAEKAYKLYIKYKKYCLFNCGKSDRHYKYVDKNKISKMLIEEHFNENILITTTCLDAGVNIIDIEVKHIIIDVKDIGSLIQCIGRRRIKNEDDKINIYIKSITNKQLGGIKSDLIKKMNIADYRKEHTVKETILKYPRYKNIDNIVYDDVVDEDNKCTIKINEMMYFKCLIEVANIDTMIQYGKFGYCKFLACLFKFVDDSNGKFSYEIEEEDEEGNKLKDYLNNMVGKVILQQKDRKQLIEKIDVKANGKQLKGINNLNGALEEMGIPYRIVEFETSKIINDEKKKFKHAWRVEKLVV